MTEAQIQAQCVKLIRKYPGVTMCFSIPNEAPGSNKVRAMQMVAMGLYSGVADLEIWLTNGWTLYAEMKDHKGKQSPRQARFQEKCSPPRVYRICRSWEDVREYIDWGLSLDAVRVRE